MYFPEDMNFQYFFFDTYIGYFLQALPIALVVGAIYGIIRYRADKETPISRKLFSCAFVCYITGLVWTQAEPLAGSVACLTLYPISSTISAVKQLETF